MMGSEIRPIEMTDAATTPVVAASVISMGLISLPIMLRYGYDRRVASGVIAASGTLAQIIPPSLVLIVLADQLGKSVGDMYKGAFIPGFVLTAMYAGYVLMVSLARPQWAPALPPEARSIREADGSSGMRSLLVLLAIRVPSWLRAAPNWWTELDGYRDQIVENVLRLTDAVRGALDVASAVEVVGSPDESE